MRTMFTECCITRTFFEHKSYGMYREFVGRMFTECRLTWTCAEHKPRICVTSAYQMPYNTSIRRALVAWDVTRMYATNVYRMPYNTNNHKSCEMYREYVQQVSTEYRTTRTFAGRHSCGYFFLINIFPTRRVFSFFWMRHESLLRLSGNWFKDGYI